MGARRPLHAPPPNSAEPGPGALLRGGGEKVSFTGKKGFRRADAARPATLLQLAVFLFVCFPHAAPGHERASLRGVKERSLPGSARGGRAHAARSADVHSRLEVCAGLRMRAGCGAQGRARGRRTAMGAANLRAPAAALGLLLCAVLGRAGPVEGSRRGVTAERLCPAPCRCLGELLDCSRQRLVRLPEPLPPWVARL